MDDREIKLADLTAPLLAFAGAGDGIAPVQCVRPIVDLVPGIDDLRFEIVPGGHLGMLTGRAARSTTWRIMDEWIAAALLGRRREADAHREKGPARGPRQEDAAAARPRRRTAQEGAREEGVEDRDRLEPGPPLRLRRQPHAGREEVATRPVTLAAGGASAVSPDWRLAVVLVLLVAIGGRSPPALGRLGTESEHVTAALRAVVQLAVVSLVIAAALAACGCRWRSCC